MTHPSGASYRHHPKWLDDMKRAEGGATDGVGEDFSNRFKDEVSSLPAPNSNDTLRGGLTEIAHSKPVAHETPQERTFKATFGGAGAVKRAEGGDNDKFQRTMTEITEPLSGKAAPTGD